MARTVRTETRERGFFGLLFKYLFIAFNLLMIVWTVGAVLNVGGVFEGAQSNAEKAGAAIGTAIGFGAIIFLWVAGDIILGLFVLLTRGKRIIVEEAAAIAFIGLLAVATPSDADEWNDLERMNMANALGDMLASEQTCGFSYDQSAIEAYIDKNVPADDMSFSSMLSAMTAGAEFQIEDMTPSQKTAHCRQIGRVAKANGFID